MHKQSQNWSGVQYPLNNAFKSLKALLSINFSIASDESIILVYLYSKKKTNKQNKNKNKKKKKKPR